MIEITKEIKDNDKTKITFKLNKNKTSIDIMRHDKKIGHIYSQAEDGMTPYPHNNTIHCLNSVQICGFDDISQTWGCGPFRGKKDCVIKFMPIDDNDYYQKKLKDYEEYVKGFFKSEIKEVKTGIDKFSFVKTKARRELTELKSFHDFVQHDGND